MFKIFCITNRNLCGNFLKKLDEIAQCRPDGIILREKDLRESEYTELAEKAINICSFYDVPYILHSFVKPAEYLKADKMHFPLNILRETDRKIIESFSEIGASCHSAEEAREAVSLGADYIIAGHIFDTDCKKGLAGRGTDFLKEVCDSVYVPVYAVGGITADNIGEVRSAGASGVCIMSGFMKCENIPEYMKLLRGEANEIR